MPPISNPNTRGATLIDFDAAKGRFLISCPVFDNGRVRALPNRRWNKTNNNWIVPAIRANIEAMVNLYSGNAVWTKAAREKMDGYASERKKKTNAEGMPSWYSFKRPPREKQRMAMEKVYGLNKFALLMDMRTGKTKVFIDVVCALRMENRVCRVILLCPLSCRRNWLNEIALDATIPVDAYLLDTDKPKNFYKWLHQPHDFKWLVVGIESLAAGSAIKYVTEFAESHTRVMCGIDESSRIKTHNATRSKNAVSLRTKCEYRAIMSGRPMTVNPLDLFMQYEFLDPDIIGLGDFFSFKARYAVMGGYEEKQIIGYDNLEELAELVAPYTVQVRQDEVLDHNAVTVIREVTMTPQQKAYYQDLKKLSAIRTADVTIVVQNVLEKMLRLQEVVGGYVSRENTEAELLELRSRMGPKAKLPRTRRLRIEGKNPKVEDVLQCAEDYPGPTIVWCAFKDEIYEVRDALRAKYGHDQVVEIHGDVSEADRHESIEERFKKGKARFLVGNAATGGIGLTLDIAWNIIFYSNTFKFEDRSQAEQRATKHLKTTLIIDIVARGTTDEIIIKSNECKLDVTEYVRRLIEKLRDKSDIDLLTAAAMSDTLAPG